MFQISNFKFMDFPAEILSHIFEYVQHLEIAVLLRVCQFWHGVMIEYLQWKIPRQFTIERVKVSNKFIALQAARQGYHHLALWACQDRAYKPAFLSRMLAELTASNCSATELSLILKELDTLALQPRVFAAAVKSNNLAKLKLLIQHDCPRVVSNCIEQAIQFGSLETLIWLRDQGITITQQEFHLVENNGRDDIFEWLLSTKFPSPYPKRHLGKEVLRRGHLKYIQKVSDWYGGLVFDYKSLRYAIDSGNLGLVKLVNKYQPQHRGFHELAHAYRGGHDHIVSWVKALLDLFQFTEVELYRLLKKMVKCPHPTYLLDILYEPRYSIRYSTIIDVCDKRVHMVNDIKLFLNAISAGHLDTIRFWYEHHTIYQKAWRLSPAFCRKAVEKERVEVFLWLLREGFNVDTEILNLLVQKGHLRLTKLLLQRGCVANPETIAIAARRGDLNMLKLLYRFGCQIGPNPLQAINNIAASKGYLRILEWTNTLSGWNYPQPNNRLLRFDRRAPEVIFHPNIGLSAAAEGKIRVVRWLHQHGKLNVNPNLAVAAVQSGNVEMVAWLLTEFKIPLRLDACISAMLCGYKLMVIWLFEHGYLTPEFQREVRTALATVESNRPELVAWFERLVA
jgi:hypothetical protein